MGTSPEKGDHPVSRDTSRDNTKANHDALDAMQTKEGQKALLSAGSNADMSNFPSVDQLLQQFDKNVQQEKQEHKELAKDDKQMAKLLEVGQPALESHNERERDYLKSLGANELKDVGEFTQALKSGSFDEAERVVQRYTEHPGKFHHLINEPVHLEMQRLGLDKKYDLEFYETQAGGFGIKVHDKTGGKNAVLYDDRDLNPGAQMFRKLHHILGRRDI